MSDTILIEPLLEPIHLAHARAHLRAPSGDTSQDANILGMIAAARRRAESFCHKALVRQQRLLALGCFPAEIEVPVGPLRAVQSIQYLDTAGVLQTLASSAYRVDTLSERGRIEPEYGTVWPSTHPVNNAVRIKYTAGYAAPIASADAGADTLAVAGHDKAADDPVRLSNSGGTLGGGLATTTQYYVKAPTADAMQLSLTEGGAAVNITADAFSGNSFVGMVPDEIVSAILLIVGHLYERREDTSDFEAFEIPLRAENLLSPYRSIRF
jgi:uncharacterized phiE125 gp8 family phage protein